VLIALIAVPVVFRVVAAAAPARPPLVLVVPIEGTIDLGMGPFVERALREAAESQAVAVVLDVNTLGGRVDAAIAIRNQLLGSAVPTVAFINPRAISAGALIALAAETIVVARGATIGAATPVLIGRDGELPQPLEEKTLSYVRKELQASC
jgi:membrane-bound serine protease (ClpP class)